MPLGYKYVERNADSQINWAEVGREASGMLLEVNRVREEKKEAYNQATREEMNNLMNTPQGENQDANGFINNYAHDMIEQMKIDEDLFKRGMLKERDYTLKRQNNMDGTKSLFEIQKLYQTKYKEKMDGVMSGKLQSMNIFNMGMVEGYGDFNNSKATVNPVDGTVGIGLMENKIIDGKSVRVLSKNIAPVNVIRGKIMHDVPTFDVGKATTDTVANFGSRKDILYSAASTAGAGTITELMGPDFLAVKKDPTTQKIVNDMNDAINDKVSSFFSNPYNLSSVMTENLGKYNAQSFTFDKDESDNDPNKILVKVDPNTQMTTLDNTGKNYEAQKKEASDWVRRDILSKMDQERGIKTTAQNELQERRAKTEGEYAREDEESDAKEFARQLVNLTVGDATKLKNSLPYFQSLLEDEKGEATGFITTTKDGIQVKMKSGETKLYKYNENGQLANPKALQRQLVSALNTRGLNDDMIGRALDKLADPKAKLNTSTQAGGYERNVAQEVTNKLAVIQSSDFNDKDNEPAVKKLSGMFSSYNSANPNDKITLIKGTGAFNDITIKKKGAPDLILNTNETTANADGMVQSIQTWVNENLDSDAFLGTKKKAGSKTTKTTAAGGNVR